MAPTFKLWAAVALKGLAQVAFAENTAAGVLVVAGIGLVSPWGALGATIGCLLGTIAGKFQKSLSEPEWKIGLAGPNPAIIGIFWGSTFATGRTGAATLVSALVVCIALEWMARPLLRRFRLPLLSAPAVVTAYVVNAVYSISGESFWHVPETTPFGNAGILAAVLLVGGAMFTKSRVAAVQVAVLGLAFALIAGHLLEIGGLASAGLWAFTVVPASFALHAVFLAGSAVGGWMGLLAAAIGGTIWFAWVFGPMSSIAPPLLCPFILAVWLTMVIAGRVYGTMVFDPRLWEVAQEIRCARDGGRSVVALTGAGLSTSSGIPDYVSGTWFRPGIPAKAYSFERFLASFRCRREYWIACDDFRRTAGNARPNLGHRALTEMERNGWLTSTITQNVDGLHQGAGARLVVELHGNITGINCLSCGWTGEWPPEHLWEKYDLHCQSCSGLLKPAVIALGERIPRGAWTAAEKAIENCGVMMVIGSQIAISSAANLVSKARLNHARVVINSIGKVAQAPVPKDVVVAERAEIFLPALAVLLDCPVPSTDKDSNSCARRLSAKA